MLDLSEEISNRLVVLTKLVSDGARDERVTVAEVPVAKIEVPSEDIGCVVRLLERVTTTANDVAVDVLLSTYGPVVIVGVCPWDKPVKEWAPGPVGTTRVDDTGARNSLDSGPVWTAMLEKSEFGWALDEIAILLTVFESAADSVFMLETPLMTLVDSLRELLGIWSPLEAVETEIATVDEGI